MSYVVSYPSFENPDLYSNSDDGSYIRAMFEHAWSDYAQLVYYNIDKTYRADVAEFM